MKRLLLGILLVLVACAPKIAQQGPTAGFDLHIDAKRHVEFDRSFVVHHYCKMYQQGFAECQLYEGDSLDAKLVGIEVVIGKELYDSFNPEEQKQWHHHEEEIGRQEVDIQLPGLSAEKAAEVAKTLSPTYGKIYIVWEPNENTPLTQPKVVIV